MYTKLKVWSEESKQETNESQFFLKLDLDQNEDIALNVVDK